MIIIIIKNNKIRHAIDRWSHMWLDSKMCHQDPPSRKDFSNCKQCGHQTASSGQLLRSQKLSLWRPLYPVTEQWGDTKTPFHPDANHSDATFHCRPLCWISHHFVRIPLQFPSVQPCLFLFLFIGFWALINSVCPKFNSSICFQRSRWQSTL